jgi:hypothetical protein
VESSTANARKRKAPQRWNNDGVDGGKSSIDIVLEWISEPRNFSRWKGGVSKETKDSLCSEILAIMREAGISARNKGDIRTKIQEIINDYNKASDWLRRTGEGIMQEDSPNASRTIEGISSLYASFPSVPFHHMLICPW